MGHIGKIGFNNKTEQKWIPDNERKWVFLAIIISTLIVFMGLWKICSTAPADLHRRSFEFIFKNYGSNSRIAIFFVLAYYGLTFILKKQWVSQWNAMKHLVISLSRFARKWHTPIAVIALGFIILHVVGAFLYGFKFDFHYLSGLLALVVLLPVPLSGLLRYNRMDKKWHLRLGLGFAVLFLIHAFV